MDKRARRKSNGLESQEEEYWTREPGGRVLDKTAMRKSNELESKAIVLESHVTVLESQEEEYWTIEPGGMVLN